MHADRVLVVVAADHGLSLAHDLQRRDLVLERRGAFELQRLRRLQHLRLEVAQQRAGVASQQPHRTLQQGFVVLPRDEPDARRRASPDLVLDARPRAVVEHVVGAVAQRGDLVQQAQRAAHSLRRRIRAEVERVVVAPPAHEPIPRPRFLRVEPQHQERLVVLELDVVGRLVLLDDRVLKQQRFLLGRGRDELDVDRLVLEEPQQEPSVAAGPQVVAHARAQVRRLARVERAAVRSEELVDAGPFGKARDLAGDPRVHRATATPSPASPAGTPRRGSLPRARSRGSSPPRASLRAAS